jgi:hypothetical protein
MAAAAAASAAAVATARARRRVIGALTDQSAFSAESAAPLPTLSGLQARMLRDLLRRGIVVDAGGERYFVDEAANAAFEARQRRIGVIVLLGLLAVMLCMVAAMSLAAVLHARR